LAALALAAASLAATRPSQTEATRSTTATEEPRPLFGIVGHARRDTQLVRLDPRSLRPLRGPRFDLVDFVNAWAFSPDRSRVALGTSCQAGVSLGSLQLVDVRRMRPLGCFVIGRRYGGGVTAIAWPTRNRMFAVSQSPPQVVLIDAKTRRVIQRTPLDGISSHSARAGDRLVVLTGRAPDRSEKLVVADPRGGVRSVAVDAPRAMDFVVDPDGSRAYLVSGGTVAEVDLATLAVTYHAVREPVSLFRRALSWLVPAAEAKDNHQEQRRTIWLGGLIASFGSDVTFEGGTFTSRPLGLRLIDTRDWTVRTVNEQVSFALLAGDVLLAVGADEIGLVAYGLEGTALFQLFAGRPVVPLESYAGKSWISVGRPTERLKIVNVRTGRVVGTGPLPTLLVER
jgi:hypothetical protein